MPLTPATETDIAEVSRQLGRPARDIRAIAARCVCGKPTVVHTAPRLSDGTPFPTTYYLTHRGATSAVSTLEASGLMAELQQRLAEDPELAAAYQKAHEAYIADRDRAANWSNLYFRMAKASGAQLLLLKFLVFIQMILSKKNDVPEIAGISAGGMPTRVKCLHALIGHALAAGQGVNPIGDIALELCSWSPNRCVCESF